MLAVVVALAVLYTPPVPGRVVRPFQPPPDPWSAGHRGLDYAITPGEAVHAVGDGVVVFAGTVARTLHVSVRHPDGKLTTVSFLETISVRAGAHVHRGDVVGTAGGVDPYDPEYDGTVLFLSLRVGGVYVDPATLFGPPDLAAIVHLAPWQATTGPRRGRSPAPPGDASRAVQPGQPVQPAPARPAAARSALVAAVAATLGVP
jgi:murein DD-endopeptidase MepM/ murein hydrolase activator NlpD